MAMNLTLISFAHLNTNSNTSFSMPSTHPRTVYKDLRRLLDTNKILFCDQGRGFCSLSDKLSQTFTLNYHLMHPLLRRWLHKCHRLGDISLRSSFRKDAREPVNVPTKYVCEELAAEYARFWTRIREEGGVGLEEIQKNALARWHACRFPLGVSTVRYPLPIGFLVVVFDDYVFLGSLRRYTTVKVTDETHANSGWVGLTTGKMESIPSRPPQIQIELKKLPDQRWTRELVQDSVDTLLHEMSHAFLMIYSSPGGHLGNWPGRRVVETEGLTGHGPCWVVVAEAIAAEANRALGEVWNKWDLNIAESCCLEREALRELWMR